MARILALDIGEKRIGLAVSDASKIISQGLDTINRKDPETTLSQIKALIKEYDVSKVIVGMPFNMNGTKGASARLIEEFVVSLKKEISVQIETMDERLTTVQSRRILLEADISRKKRKKVIDKIAAQLILQTYLESHV